MLTLLLALASAPAALFPVPTQSVARPRPVPAPVKNAGVYHVATKTWTRTPSATANFGPHRLYVNTTPTGYMFAPVETTWEMVDTGSLPSTNFPNFPGFADAYPINGFQVGYCTSNRTANTSFTYTFYERFGPCTELRTNELPVASFEVNGLPGSGASGTFSCWVVIIDLQGTTGEFCFGSDGGDGVWDDDVALDSFGFGTVFNNVDGGAAGPLVRGDPVNFPRGDCTAFQNPQTCTATGLGTVDEFWVSDCTGFRGVHPGGNTDCYFFGGYPGNPYASFHLQLFGDAFGAPCSNVGLAPIGEPFCSARRNSIGFAGIIGARGSAIATDQDVTLIAECCPPSVPGLFFFSSTPLAGAPFGEGLRCVGGMSLRVQPAAFTGGGMFGDPVVDSHVASRALDFAAPYAASILPGDLHFQFWYRDPMGGPAGFNTTDALTITFQ